MKDTALYHHVCFLLLLEMIFLTTFGAQSKELVGVRLTPATDQHKSLTMKDLFSSLIGRSKEEEETRSSNIPSKGVNLLQVPEDVPLISTYTYSEHEGTWESEPIPIQMRISAQTNSSELVHSSHVEKRGVSSSSPSEDPKVRLGTCLREQSHRSAQHSMDLPAHVQFHLSDDWLDEATHLSTFSLPSPCIDALCHPAINVSFRVVTNASANSTRAFMAMYGQAMRLLDQCRAHLQIQPHLQRTVDHEGNTLYQIANHYILIIFQNQSCHYTHSLSKISALTTLQVFEQSPPLCLQNLLCSPSTLLEQFKGNPSRWVWIPTIQGSPAVDDLVNCFHHFQDSQTQESPVAYVNIVTGHIQHDIVLFSNPQCYINRSERFMVNFAVATDNIPPSSCLSILCDQRFRFGYHQGNTFYIMAFGQDVPLVSKCRFQLSSDSRSNRTYTIKGFIFPLNQMETFFLPDLDCYAFTSVTFTPVFVSIAIHNIAIPEPCLALLCNPDALITTIANKCYYGSLDSNNLTASCFDAMTPNPETNDALRVLPVSPSLNIFQIAPMCTRQSKNDIVTFMLYALTLDSSVLFPASCYSHLCYGAIGIIEKKKERVRMYYVVGSKTKKTGCYSSLLTLNRDTRIATDSKNCSFALVHLPGRVLTVTMTNMVAVSDPKCQIHESITDAKFGYQYADMFASNFIDNVSDVQNVFFDCLAKKIQDTYGFFSDYFPLLLLLYGKGVHRRIPDSCIHLACNREILISSHFILRAAGLGHAYIAFHSMTREGIERLIHCNQTLIAPYSSDDSTPMSQGTLIPSNVDLRGFVAVPPNQLFLVFPPTQCSVVQNIIKASVISYYLTIRKEFPQECVERFICNSNVELISPNESLVYYITYDNAYEDNDRCFGYFENAENCYSPQNSDVKVMHWKYASCFSSVARYILFDVRIKPAGKGGRELVSELILGKHYLGPLVSCVRCIPQSSVVRKRVMRKNMYLMVSYGTESEYCHQCYQSGTRVGNFSGLVLVLNNKNLTLFMIQRNAPPPEKSLITRYLYFVVHHLEKCARLDQGNFRTLFYLNGDNIIDIYFIQNEEGLSCLEQIRKSSKFSCFQNSMYTICLEHETHVAILYLPKCYSLSSDKLEIISNLILNSTENSETILKRIIDLCNSDTHVASYVIPNDKFYFETTGRTSSFSCALAALQPKWRLTPADFCLSILQSSFHTCANASSKTKVEELVQSQIGIATGRNELFEFLFQCITFVHPNATLRLYRLIHTNNLVSREKDSHCNSSFKTSGEKVLGIFLNDSFSIQAGNFYLGSPNVRSDGAFSLIPTGSCLPLKNDIKLASATASVIQNNTACLQDLCNRNFLLPSASDGQFSFIGPLSNSLYRSSCFKALPPQVWTRITEAFQTGRVTINKFWPGYFYDFIILSNAKDSKIDEWCYLSTVYKGIEIICFLGSLMLTMITIVGNSVIIYTLFYHKKMNDPSCRLRINLAFADLLVGLFVECRALHNHLSLMTGEIVINQLDQLGIYSDFQENLEKFSFGFNQIRFSRTGYEAFCGFVFSVSSFVSLTFMSLITLERFLMVAYQRHHGMVFSQSRLTKIILATWVGGIVFSFLLLQKEEGQVFVGYFDPLSKITTSLPSSNIRSTSFITFYIVVVFFSLTSFLVVIVSVMTFWKFITSHERLRKHNIYANAQMKEALNQKFRVVLKVFVGTYLLSCVPLAVGSAFNIFLLSPACHRIMWWIYLSGSAWNCYVYNFRLTKFRKDIRDAFLCITIPMGHSWVAFASDTYELKRSTRSKVSSMPPNMHRQMTSSV